MSGTPKKGYFLKDGTKVKGSTTILGGQCAWGAKALQYWSWQQGINGIDYKEAMKSAGGAGTLAHDMIEAHLKDSHKPDVAGYTLEQAMQAQKAYEAFLHWYKGEGIDVVMVEPQLVSEQYGYGGTPDCIAFVRGELSLLDWKTSNAVYGNYICQLGSYRQLWNEGHDDKIGGAYLFRMDKECSGWANHYFPPEQIDLGWEAFQHMLALDRIEGKIRL